MVWVVDTGFASAENRAYLQRAGGHYIVGRELRGGTQRGQGRARPRRAATTPSPATWRSKRCASATAHDAGGSSSAATPRWPRATAASARTSSRTSSRRSRASDNWTKQRRDELACKLRPTPGPLASSAGPRGRLSVDKGEDPDEERFDGKFLLRTSDDTLSPTDIALAYKQLYRGRAGLARPEGSALGCGRSSTTARTASAPTSCSACSRSCSSARSRPDRRHLAQHPPRARPHAPRHPRDREGRVAQRSATTPRQQQIFTALGVTEPARFYDFELPEPVA